MIGDPAIRIVVSSYFLRAVTAADQGAALLGLLSRLLALCFIEQFCLEQAHRTCSILVLAAFVLAFNDDPCGKMRDPDG